MQAKQIALQSAFLQSSNQVAGAVSNWLDFLNWYYWLQHAVDAQVGIVLDALQNSVFAGNTIVIFASDHGEYAGSHGLHGKGGAVYDESLHVPLWVRLPGATTASVRNQMCSSVDFFGLICDLGTAGLGSWVSRYPDLAHRESIYSFLYDPYQAEQKRIAPGLNTPYILHTTDETMAGTNPAKAHVVCLRTKSDLTNIFSGAKYAVYNQWAQCSTTPDPAVPPDQEFYDYANPNRKNRGELGNDYLQPDSQTAALIAQFKQALGTYGSPGTGLIGFELTLPLQGVGTDGQPLVTAQKTAKQAYLDFIAGAGVCQV